MKHTLTLLTALLLTSLAAGLGVAAPASGADGPPKREKKIFAHYMGCYPVAAAATAYHRSADAHQVRHDGQRQHDAYGDRWRNWPLVPEGLKLSLEESADLEIRRALRGGIDGFAIDAWAGGDGAKAVCDALFQVAEQKDYPFEITICLDAGIQDNAGLAASIKYLLDKHGASPKLARRDGKPLIFGYMSSFVGFRHGAAELRNAPSSRMPTSAICSPTLAPLTEEGWQHGRRPAGDAKDRRYRPILPLVHERLLPPVPNGKWTQDDLVRAAGFMGQPFGRRRVPRRRGHARQDGHGREGRRGRVVRALFFQYENIGWGGNRISTGFNTLRDRWQHARDNGSTLIQFITWNDYTENTCLAPAYDTRYAILDLNAWFVQWWKTGKEPKTDHDRVYFSYRKYPHGAKLFPFQPKQGEAKDGVLEVLTILTAPAQVRLPGRDARWDASAGMSFRQFPLMPGPVSAELVRNGQHRAPPGQPRADHRPAVSRDQRDDLLLDGVSATLEGRLRRRPAAAPGRVRRRRRRRPAQLVRDVLVRQVPGLEHRDGCRPRRRSRRGRTDEPPGVPRPHEPDHAGRQRTTLASFEKQVA